MSVTWHVKESEVFFDQWYCCQNVFTCGNCNKLKSFTHYIIHLHLYTSPSPFTTLTHITTTGAYAVMMDDDDEVKEFFAQDIDKILEQRSHVLVTEGSKETDTWLNKKKKNRAR